MKSWIALLRGINVGGRNTLPMSSLKVILRGLGASQVQTYIQSGNVVFRADASDRFKLAKQLGAAIQQEHEFEPEVLIFDIESLDAAMQANPFPDAEADPSTLHLGFLLAAPEEPKLDELEALRKPTERYQLTDEVFYLHAPDGIGRSKLVSNCEKLIGVNMTVRNWRTIDRIRSLIK